MFVLFRFFVFLSVLLCQFICNKPETLVKLTSFVTAWTSALFLSKISTNSMSPSLAAIWRGVHFLKYNSFVYWNPLPWYLIHENQNTYTCITSLFTGLKISIVRYYCCVEWCLILFWIICFKPYMLSFVSLMYTKDTQMYQVSSLVRWIIFKLTYFILNHLLQTINVILILAYAYYEMIHKCIKWVVLPGHAGCIYIYLWLNNSLVEVDLLLLSILSTATIVEASDFAKEHK